MSKKIISLVLAVLMVFSVFAVSAFAVGPVSQIGIKFVTNAKVGDAAGTEITVDCYLTFPEGTDFTEYKHGLTQIAVLYNTEYYTYVSREIGAAYQGFIKSASLVNTKAYAVLTKDNKLTEEEASTYNAGLLVAQAWDSTQTEVTNKTGYTIDPNCPLFTLTFRVNKDLESVDAATFSSPLAAVGKQTKITYFDGKNTSKYYTTANTTVAEATKVGPAGETYKVSDGAVKIRRNAVESAKYDLGFTGSFKKSDFAVAFNDKGTSTNLTKVGVKVTMNGVTNEYTDRFVYETADGYQFRAVLAGLDDSMADMEISVVMFIEFDGVRYESKGLTTTLGAHTGRLPA